MRRLRASIVAGVLALVAWQADATGAAHTLKAGVFEPPQMAPDFSIQGSDGRELKLATYRGKVVALAFGFSHCEEVCPATLATLAQARKLLGAAGDSMQVVYITVDPQRDDAARMKAWVTAFDPSFVGGTGRPEALAAVRKSYGIVADKHPSGDGYVMAHSSSIFLIDTQGRLRALMPYGRKADDFAHDVKLLLAP